MWYNQQVAEVRRRFLGVAQLVARYLGVVEAASSSLVTQTMASVLIGFKKVHKNTRFFYVQMAI